MLCKNLALVFSIAPYLEPCQNVYNLNDNIKIRKEILMLVHWVSESPFVLYSSWCFMMQLKMATLGNTRSPTQKKIIQNNFSYQKMCIARSHKFATHNWTVLSTLEHADHLNFKILGWLPCHTEIILLARAQIFQFLHCDNNGLAQTTWTCIWISSNERGEPIASYRWLRSSLRNNWLPIVEDGFMEYTSTQ